MSSANLTLLRQILCALKISRFPVAAMSHRGYPFIPERQDSLEGNPRAVYLYIYKDEGTRTFSRPYVVRIRRLIVPVVHPPSRT